MMTFSPILALKFPLRDAFLLLMTCWYVLSLLVVETSAALEESISGRLGRRCRLPKNRSAGLVPSSLVMFLHVARAVCRSVWLSFVRMIMFFILLTAASARPLASGL
jgi:hypothetical protein